MTKDFIIQTQGAKYAGSKLKVIPHIFNIVNELPDIRSVLDGFTGTSRVAQAFAKMGFDVTASDTALWSEVFAKCYLLANKDAAFYQPMLDELNNLKGIYGWFSQNYGGTEEQSKKPFQLKNTMKLDAIREKIDSYNLDLEDKAVLLTSLILALDEVDNTLGHYAAYLSKWSKRSYKELTLKMPQKFFITTHNRVIRDDVLNVVKGQSFDLAYFDPPYGSSNQKMPSSRVRYNAYYHLWKTIILNDKPEVFGKAARRVDSKDTASYCPFEDFHTDEHGNFVALNELEELIKTTHARYIILSYSSSGRATKQSLIDILNNNGKLLNLIELDHRRNIMSYLSWTKEWLSDKTPYKEYLFLLQKQL